MTQPLLSVVIPVVARRPGLKRCVQSAISSLFKTSVQPLATWEIVLKVSEYLNEDDMVDEITESMPDNLRLGTFRSVVDQPREMFDSWNQCVRLARGKYVHILHDDDWVRPDFYPSVWPHLLRGCSAVATGYEVEEANGIVSYESRIKREGGQLCGADLLRGNCLVPSCVVVAKEFYEKGGWFRGYGCMDWDCWIRLAGASVDNPWVIVPELLVRQMRGADSSEAIHGKVKTAEQLLETIEELEQTTGKVMPARTTYFNHYVNEAVAAGDVDLFRAAIKFRRT